MFKQFFASLINKSTKAEVSANLENQSDQPDTQPSDSLLQTIPSGHDVTSPWNLPTWQAVFLLLFALTVGLILFLRLFQLDTLQVEIYGDIDIVLNYMVGILAGGWPVQFQLSAGPLYHYLIFPVILVTKLDYANLKLASVIISLAGLAATYAFSRRLFNDYFALLVTFVAGVSSWLLIFSRLGNSQIVLPLLTMVALWLVVRIVQFGRQRDVIICALVSGLGLFAYPQSFILPGVIFLTLVCLRWVGQPLPKGWVIRFVLASIPCLLLFGWLVASDPSNFTDGYIGGKIRPGEGDDLISVLLRNITNSMLALHVRGDDGFRSNPLALPHLDWISGILFLCGIVFWLVDKERRRWIPVWLAPFILLQVPSILVLSQVAEVPSASRTLGVAPIVYMLVASGIWWLVQAFYVHSKRWGGMIVLSLLLGSILFLNIERYFQTYTDALVYNNTPIGQRVATYANTLPSDTQVYMVGCCWEYGMPENFVAYEMTHPENLHYVDPVNMSCTELQSVPLPAVFIWSFYVSAPAPQLELCKQWLPAQVYQYKGRPVFNAAPLRPDLGMVSGIPGTSEGLDRAEIQLDGQTTQVYFSRIDTGSIEDLFDGDREVLIRGERANPMVMALHFSQPRKISTVELDLGTMPHFHVTVAVMYRDNTLQSVDSDYENLPDDPHVSIALPEYVELITSIRVVVQDMGPLTDSDYHIHIRELQVK